MLDHAVTLLERDPAETTNLAAALLNRSFAHLKPEMSGERGPTWSGVSEWRQTEAMTGRRPRRCTISGTAICWPGTSSRAAALHRRRRHVPADSARLPAGSGDRQGPRAAGGRLAREAAGELDSAMASFRRQRLDHDLAEAELARSEAALAAGEPAVSRRWAAAAQRRFLRHGNDAFGCLAELTRLRARSIAPGRPARVAAEAAQLAERLRRLGLRQDAELAELLAARALLAAGRLDEARRRLAATGRRRAPMPLAVRLLRRLARADLAEREGRSGTALAEVRAGLALVQTRRGRLGSVDLQTGTAALGADLAGPACGWRLNAIRRRWCSRGWNALGRRRSGSGRSSARRPAGGGRPGRAASARRLIREAELGQTRTAPGGQAGRAAAGDQGARLAGPRRRPGHRPGQPR